MKFQINKFNEAKEEKKKKKAWDAFQNIARIRKINLDRCGVRFICFWSTADITNIFMINSCWCREVFRINFKIQELFAN